MEQAARGQLPRKIVDLIVAPVDEPKRAVLPLIGSHMEPLGDYPVQARLCRNAMQTHNVTYDTSDVRFRHDPGM